MRYLETRTCSYGVNPLKLALQNTTNTMHIACKVKQVVFFVNPKQYQCYVFFIAVVYAMSFSIVPCL